MNSRLDVRESRKRRQYIKFAVYFFVLLFLFQLITHLKIVSEALTFLTTQLTFFIIKLFYPFTTLQGFHILCGIDMEIIYECTGIYGIIAFSSAILATWYPFWEKCRALLFGVPFIYFLNLVRLVTIFLISQLNPKLFDFMHTYFWQLFLLFFVVYFFYYWYSSMQKKYPSPCEL